MIWILTMRPDVITQTAPAIVAANTNEMSENMGSLPRCTRWNAAQAANALSAVMALLPMNFRRARGGGLFSFMMRHSCRLMLPTAATKAAEPASYLISSTSTTGNTITTTVFEVND